jgi:hypothetical protein
MSQWNIGNVSTSRDIVYYEMPDSNACSSQGK